MSLIATGLFQLSTLPIEFNASKRAAAELDSLNYLGEGEVEGVKKTLNAAAMTYVIAFVTTMMFVTILLLRVLARRK
ncbi:MAG: hypothetical protein DRP42_01680 [Tenericutes bacterium]|nr:MAG: hypothetical protein DRP42_01680 [Mycoplasmatota bacterium]